MKTFRKISLMTAILAALIFGGLLMAQNPTVIPRSLWGRYCPEDNKKCEPREFYISANSLWSESDGGCAQVEKVEKKGDTVNLYCKDAPNVTIEPVSKGKIRITIPGDSPRVVQKLK